MQVFRLTSEVPAAFGPSVVAIGNFDGVHRGHLSILADVCARAQARGVRAVAVTFDPHPLRVLRPEYAPRLITPLEQRLRLLAEVGAVGARFSAAGKTGAAVVGLGATREAELDAAPRAELDATTGAGPEATGARLDATPGGKLDATLVLPFTLAFSHYSAEAFATEVLAHTLGAVEVHEGDNFRFGYQAQAGMAELRELGLRLGFSAFTHPVLTVRGMSVASSQIRTLVSSGEVARARALLGRPFSILSTQARGRGIGTRLLVPTINLAPYDELLPAHGVYVTRLRIGDGPHARCFDAVTNAGNRPTFGEDSFAVESYLLEFDPASAPEITPETPLELSFLARLRGEQRFASPEALKAQIMRDVARAKRYFRLIRALAESHVD